MAVCSTLSALSSAEITTSLTCTIATTAQTKRAATRTVTTKHRACAPHIHTPDTYSLPFVETMEPWRESRPLIRFLFSSL